MKNFITNINKFNTTNMKNFITNINKFNTTNMKNFNITKKKKNFNITNIKNFNITNLNTSNREVNEGNSFYFFLTFMEWILYAEIFMFITNLGIKIPIFNLSIRFL